MRPPMYMWGAGGQPFESDREKESLASITCMECHHKVFTSLLFQQLKWMRKTIQNPWILANSFETCLPVAMDQLRCHFNTWPNEDKPTVRLFPWPRSLVPSRRGPIAAIPVLQVFHPWRCFQYIQRSRGKARAKQRPIVAPRYIKRVSWALCFVDLLQIARMGEWALRVKNSGQVRKPLNASRNNNCRRTIRYSRHITSLASFSVQTDTCPPNEPAAIKSPEFTPKIEMKQSDELIWNGNILKMQSTCHGDLWDLVIYYRPAERTAASCAPDHLAMHPTPAKTKELKV